MRTIIIALYPYRATGQDAWLDHGAGMTYTTAREAGYNVNFLDLKTLSNDQELERRLRGYDLVAFGLKSAQYSIAMNVIRIAKLVGAKVLIGGCHVTAAADELLENPNIDWVFHGESEITFPKFLKNPDAFPREIWGEKPSTLDDLPFMDRMIFREPVEDALGWLGHRVMITVIAARGCIYNCAFCQPLERNHFGNKVRRRSVDGIISELRLLKIL